MIKVIINSLTSVGSCLAGKRIKRYGKVVAWTVGGYVALFSLVSGIHETRVNTIELRIDRLTTHAAEKHYRVFFKQLRDTYNMRKPLQPTFLYPWSTVSSLVWPWQPYEEGQNTLSDILDEVRMDLDGADLRNARLAHLDLGNAHLSGAILKTDLSGSRLIGADLSYAKLTGATLVHSDLDGAILENANLDMADCRDSYMSGALLRNASLRVCNLSHTYMRFSVCTGADFDEANLNQADLNGADLRGAKNLTLNQLLTARSLAGAKLDKALLQAIVEKMPELLEYQESDKKSLSTVEFWGEPLPLIIDLFKE